MYSSLPYKRKQDNLNLLCRLSINSIQFTDLPSFKDITLFADDLRGEMMVPPAKKLEDLIHLAELCVDLLQQNEEHYAEVSGQRRDVLPLGK